MLEDAEKELATGLVGDKEYNSAIPDTYSKTLARNLMKQLRENWRNDEINMKVAKATIRVPLLKLVDFDKEQVAERVKNEITNSEDPATVMSEDTAESSSDKDDETIEQDETEIEYAAVNSLHKDGVVG